jgi:hypothetical protein
MVDAPRTETITIPAEYGTIERRTQITPEKAEWRQVLCEANANSTVISAIQRALQTQGYYNGAIDGRLGRLTYASVERFQTARGLSTGGLTLTTVDALGVDWRSMVGGANTIQSGGFTTGGTVTGSTTGFTTGTTVTTTTTGGYTIGADRTVRDASGTVIGRLDGNGNVINSAGTIVLRGLAGSTSGTVSGGSVGGYAIGADGTVRDSSGRVIGRMNGSGDVVNSAGTVVLRGLSATSGSAGSVGSTISGGGFSSGTVSGGSITSGGSSSSTGGLSVGDFQVRADGMVVSRSTGAVIGRVDASGNVINAAGTVIGRVN